MTRPDPDLRDRIAKALWGEAERTIIAEWICCDPVNPKHQLCVQGEATMRMVRSLIFDGERTLADAVLAVLPDNRAAALSETERRMLEYALDLADEEVARDGSEFSDDEEDALAELRRLAGEAQQDPAPGGVRRCRHNDIVYGLCILSSIHDGECVHEHQPRCSMPSPDGQYRCVLPPNHEGLHAEKHLAEVMPNGNRMVWETPAAVARSGQPETDGEAGGLDIARCARALAGKVHPPHDWEPDPGEGLWRCPGDEPFAS